MFDSMRAYVDHPWFVFVIAFIGQSLAVYVGDFLRKRTQHLRQDERHDFDTVRATTMTLLALIIGFSFSMAVSRYDQRRTLEEAVANAIGTRAGLLPADPGAQARELLKKYLDLRITFYDVIEEMPGRNIDRDTAALQANLWAVVASAAGKQPTPIVALAVPGMNDVPQLPGVHTRGVAQSHTNRGLGPDGSDGSLLQSSCWLRRAAEGWADRLYPSCRRVGFVLSHRRSR